MCSPTPKPWMAHVLAAAAAYHLALGLGMVLVPHAAFQLAGLPVPGHASMARYCGALMAVFGAGCWFASMAPYAHWIMAALGLAGKLVDVVAMGAEVASGHLPATSAWILVPHDLVWLYPFGAVAVGAYRAHIGQRRVMAPEVVAMSLRTRTNLGETLEQMSRRQAVLLVFLRHLGCTFCREALSDLARQRESIAAQGGQLVLVHMGSDEDGERLLRRYGLHEVPRVSDKQRSLYRAFGLPRGTLSELFGPWVWWRGMQVGLFNGHGAGKRIGDGFQMPGVFLLFHGQVIGSYRHQSIADRPNYQAMVATAGAPQVDIPR